MCKIFAMTNMEKVVLSKKFINIVKNEVCKKSDDDGFGYAVLGQDGKLGGERTIRPKSFKPLSGAPEDKVVYSLPITLKSANMFGQIDLLNPKAFIAHGRLSTNTVSIENTHPFTNGEVALVHNGVVYDELDEVKESLTTNCDTEILLRYWEKGGMKAIEENVSGYYAMAVLDKAGKLHIARDDRAMLYISYCRTVHSFIIATTPDIIKGVAKNMKWNIEQPEELLENFYAVFDGNEIVKHEKIDPWGMVRAYGRSAGARALGWESEDYGYSRHYTGYGNYGTPTTTTTDRGSLSDDIPPEDEPAPSYKELIAKDDYLHGRHDEVTTETEDVSDEYRDEEPKDLVDELEGCTILKRYNRAG